MGINGAMEAFVLAKANHETTIPKFKYFALLGYACYIVSSYSLMELGYG